MTCTQDDNTVAVTLTRGDSMLLLVEFTDADGAPVNLTGWTWLSQLRTSPDDVDSVPITIDVADPAGGVLELSLAAALTAALPVRDYVFDVEATDGGGDVRTLITGQLRVKEDVSR